MVDNINFFFLVLLAVGLNLVAYQTAYIYKVFAKVFDSMSIEHLIYKLEM